MNFNKVILPYVDKIILGWDRKELKDLYGATLNVKFGPNFMLLNPSSMTDDSQSIRMDI